MTTTNAAETQGGKARSIMKWEYLIVSANLSKEDNIYGESNYFDEKGREGWELVAVAELKDAFSVASHSVIFKRPIDDAIEESA